MVELTVRVTGLKELQKKLDGKFLIAPELETVRDKLIERINRPRRKRNVSSGFANNPLAIQKYAMAMGNRPIARVTTTLNPPRTKGTSWLRFVYSLARGAFLRNQMNAAVRRIQTRWNS